MNSKIMSFLVLFFLSITIGVCFSNGACNRMTYKESQDSAFHQFCRYGSVFTKDNNVWSLSEYGQKRFGMLKEWQDRDLKGAEVAAFRLEPTGRQRCHGEGESKECVWAFACVLDLWIQNDVAIDIKGNHPLEYKPWKSSLYELGERNPELKAKWQSAFGLQGVQFLVSGKKSTENYPFEVIGYNKNLRKGMILITMVLDGRASLLPPDVRRSVSFPLVGGDSHEVGLSAAFWQRVAQLHAETSEVTELNWLGGTEEMMNLWSYSKEFAEKYNMPLSAVSDELVGAMAVAYRQEPQGVKTCGYFSDQSSCSPGGLGRWSELFDFYVINGTNLSYSSDWEIASKNGGPGKSSTYFLREQHYKDDLPEFNYDPYKLIQFIHRSREKSGEMDPKWYGGGSYGKAVIKGKAWNLDFTMSSVLQDMPKPYKGSRTEENFFLFVRSEKSLPFTKSLERNTHKISLPAKYIEAVLEYDRLHNDKVGSFLDIVKKKYEN